MRKAKLLGVILASCAFMAFALGSGESSSSSSTSTKVGEVSEKEDIVTVLKCRDLDSENARLYTV